MQTLELAAGLGLAQLAQLSTGASSQMKITSARVFGVPTRSCSKLRGLSSARAAPDSVAAASRAIRAGRVLVVLVGVMVGLPS
ncbi:MAG: hypothetical protein U1F21_13710 [Sphaerotilus natans]